MPSPLTVKEPEVVFTPVRLIPFVAPFDETLWNVNVLVSTVVRLTAVPVVVDTSRGVTLTPELELPAIAVVDPVDMSIPFMVTLFASVIVPLSVGVFAALPVTVGMPPTESVAPGADELLARQHRVRARRAAGPLLHVDEVAVVRRRAPDGRHRRERREGAAVVRAS